MDELRQRLLSGGAALVGFADLRRLPPGVREALPFGVSFAVALEPGIVARLTDGPTREYRDEYVRVNALIDELAGVVARLLRRCGRRALALPATDDAIDPELKPIALPHKTVARLAGLGWIGKCALLVTPGCGSAVRLGTVLTDAELPAAASAMESRCGDCAECVAACPGGAPTGRAWHEGMPREDIYDARACYDALESNRRRLGHSLCGLCIAVCPWTKRCLSRSGAV